MYINRVDRYSVLPIIIHITRNTSLNAELPIYGIGKIGNISLAKSLRYLINNRGLGSLNREDGPQVVPCI